MSVQGPPSFFPSAFRTWTQRSLWFYQVTGCVSKFLSGTKLVWCLDQWVPQAEVDDTELSQ